MKPLEAIRCTLPNCGCECFSPSKNQLRICESCRHGWVTHALDKLGHKHMYTLGMQVEMVQPNIVFDIASLMLYGTQATPIRLKILLDRLFSVLQHEEVIQVLHGFGWSYEDYARGYILQDIHSRVLDKWTVVHREEEHVILQQFLRFGETKTIAQEIIMQDTRDKQHHYIVQTTRVESEIKKFIERTNLSSYSRIFDARNLVGARMPFVPPGARLVAPTALHGVPVSGANQPGLEIRNHGPLSTSPLGKLRTMQPFDFRKERLSSPELLSPGSSQVKRPVALHTPDESPTNLSLNPSAEASPSKYKIPDIKHDMFTPTKYSMPSYSSEAIDYSVKDIKDMTLSVFDIDKKINHNNNKHNRKSMNPVKHHWTPSSSFGHTLISPSGKKRVLCVACNKTFCDKGALKIHYSAVHLKEMHKCTVLGCNMMFSSRRSRNRHSANPNPKLHMPQPKRTKADLIGALTGDPTLMSLPDNFSAIDAPVSGDEKIAQTILDDVTDFSMNPKKLCIDGNPDSLTTDGKYDSQDALMQRVNNRRKCMVPMRCTPPVTDNTDDKELGCRRIDLEQDMDDDTIDGGSDSDGICFREGDILGDSDMDDSMYDTPDKQSTNGDDDGHAGDIEEGEIIHGGMVDQMDMMSESELTLAKTRSRKCVACGKKFSDDMELKYHIETVHLKIIPQGVPDHIRDMSHKESVKESSNAYKINTHDLPLSLVNGQKSHSDIFTQNHEPTTKSSDEIPDPPKLPKESSRSGKRRKTSKDHKHRDLSDNFPVISKMITEAIVELPDGSNKSEKISNGNNLDENHRHSQNDLLFSTGLTPVIASANAV